MIKFNLIGALEKRLFAGRSFANPAYGGIRIAARAVDLPDTSIKEYSASPMQTVKSLCVRFFRPFYSHGNDPSLEDISILQGGDSHLKIINGYREFHFVRTLFVE